MFAITVLGGMGSIGGTLVAAVILGVSESLMATFFGPSWSLAVSFGLLLTVLAVRPAGSSGDRCAARSSRCWWGWVVVAGRDRPSPWCA
jgi:branched-subunit amino acid ABC-type transport system permease component